MTHPAPLPGTTPAADVLHPRLGTAHSTKLNNWLMAHPDEVAKHTHAQLAEVASAALGIPFNRGHVIYRLDELRRAGDLPPKASEVVQPAPAAAVPGPQLTLVTDTAAPDAATPATPAAVPQVPQEPSPKVNLRASLVSLRTTQREEITRRLDACNARRETLGVLAQLLNGDGGEQRSNLAIVQQMLDAMDAKDAR